MIGLMTPARICLMAVVLASAPTVCAESKADIRINNAAYIISDFQGIPEQSIPDALLNGAAGIAIIPNVLKVGFGVGARYGRGVLLLRRDDGDWSPPCFITLGSGSFGWQIGAQSADLVLIFRETARLNEIGRSKFTLGADASIAAGPVGRYTSASTDLKLDAEVYSYSRTKGLFAGVALDGTIIGIDAAENQSYYSQPGIQLVDIARYDPNRAPKSSAALVEQLNSVAKPTQPDAAEGSPPDDASAPPVKTFGLGERPVEDSATQPGDPPELELELESAAPTER